MRKYKEKNGRLTFTNFGRVIYWETHLNGNSWSKLSYDQYRSDSRVITHTVEVMHRCVTACGLEQY